MPIRDLAKGGWHPKGKGEGGKESWRGDFKGVNTVVSTLFISVQAAYLIQQRSSRN
jgi:hypothetical protein